MLSRFLPFLSRRPRASPDEAAMLYRQARRATPATAAVLRQRAAEGFADVAKLSAAHAFDAARLFRELGDDDRALAAADRLLAQQPDHVAGLHLRSLLLIARNRFTEALGLSRCVLALAPDHAAARYHLRTLAALDGHDGPPDPAGESCGPLLVGVGSGIGNLVHTTPMLAALARSFGRPVDVVIAAEGPETAFLLRRAGVVENVYRIDRAVLDRRYDHVFLTHSFGAFVPRFATRDLIVARDWKPFDPAGPAHEAVYNLEAACAQLGTACTPEDAVHAYVGNLAYAVPEEGPIGFHAGSKSGLWAQKRWPGFEALADRLAARGLACVSFGTPDEYVAGTIDRTGGSVEEMARAMRVCRHFVANDSGVMNLANALGIPLTALFGPTNPATRGPLGARSTIVTPPEPYRPEETYAEGRKLFRAGAARSIAGISVDDVEDAVLAALASPS